LFLDLGFYNFHNFIMEEKEIETIKLYAELGKFVVAFESMLNSILAGLYLPFEHMTMGANNYYFEIMIAGMEARALQSRFVAIYSHQLNRHIEINHNLNPGLKEDFESWTETKFEQKLNEGFELIAFAYLHQLKKRLSKINTQIDFAIEIRNHLLHSTWYEIETSESTTEIRGFKFKTTGKGYFKNNLQLQPNIFEDLVNEIKLLDEYVYLFSRHFKGGFENQTTKYLLASDYPKIDLVKYKNQFTLA